MNCAELEILICDYVDGTIASNRKADVESHLHQCPACAELARDSAAAVAFMERAANVEPPPAPVTRILYDAPWSKGHSNWSKGHSNWSKDRSNWSKDHLEPSGFPRRLGAFL